MTRQEFLELVDDQLPDNTVGQITPAKLRAVLAVLAKVMDDGGFEL
jgi:hypothetical protein